MLIIQTPKQFSRNEGIIIGPKERTKGPERKGPEIKIYENPTPQRKSGQSGQTGVMKSIIIKTDISENKKI